MDSSLMKSFLIDWVAGSLGGLALTVAGHPFE
jgi:hypothetical protein